MLFELLLAEPEPEAEPELEPEAEPEDWVVVAAGGDELVAPELFEFDPHAAAVSAARANRTAVNVRMERDLTFRCIIAPVSLDLDGNCVERDRRPLAESCSVRISDVITCPRGRAGIRRQRHRRREENRPIGVGDIETPWQQE